MCFKRSDALPLPEALTALLSLREAPPGRRDLEKWIPDDDDVANILGELQLQLPVVKGRPEVKVLINSCGLTDDDIKALIAYKLESPYPLYRWLNGWLQCNRRSAAVLDKVGPFFTLFYRAQEKLPLETKRAARAVIVSDIPALRSTFDTYQTRLAPGKPLNFWSISSFSTNDEVVNDPNFCGEQKTMPSSTCARKLKG
jgi:hypothetical protein